MTHKRPTPSLPSVRLNTITVNMNNLERPFSAYMFRCAMQVTCQPLYKRNQSIQLISLVSARKSLKLAWIQAVDSYQLSTIGGSYSVNNSTC